MAGSDRRVRYTKQVLKDSLFNLMQETPVEKITVKKLCAKAVKMTPLPDGHPTETSPGSRPNGSTCFWSAA